MNGVFVLKTFTKGGIRFLLNTDKIVEVAKAKEGDGSVIFMEGGGEFFVDEDLNRVAIKANVGTLLYFGDTLINPEQVTSYESDNEGENTLITDRNNSFTINAPWEQFKSEIQ